MSPTTLAFAGKSPLIHKTAWIAPGVWLIGDVHIHEEASLWFNCVLRADINSIHIGKRSNIQDNCTLHVADDHGVIIGDYVTVGHNAILHACEIGNTCLIGMGAIVLDGAKIGDETIIGAGTLVTGNKKFPPGVLILGNPGKVVRELTPEERKNIRHHADKYFLEIAQKYLK